MAQFVGMIGFEPISRFTQNNNFKEKLLSVFLKTKYEKINAFYPIKLHPVELIWYLLCVEMDSNHHSTIFSLYPATCGLEPRTTCPCASTVAPSTHILKIMLCFGLEPVPLDILAMPPITPSQHLSKNTLYISLSHLRPQFRPALTSLACQLVLASVSFLCIIKPNLFAEGERLELSRHFRDLTV